MSSSAPSGLEHGIAPTQGVALGYGSGRPFGAPPTQLPAPRVPVAIRPGTMEDVAFIDSLQKVYCKQLGWMPTQQLEGKIRAGHVLVAESREGEAPAEPICAAGLHFPNGSPAGLPSRALGSPGGSPSLALGYCIGNDQYFKRDDVGIIYQLCVAPGQRRALIGAALVRAMFERAAYGCRLFSCWCAQDIEANRFWESLGFVPLAFRAGSRKKARVHIFWQRRVCAGDATTPYWFPSQTAGGVIREHRLVLPIPPGTHWSDAKPMILPASDAPKGAAVKRAPSARVPKQGPRQIRKDAPINVAGGLWFAPTPAPKPPVQKPEKSPAKKNDPKHIAAARELRDRYLEEMNHNPALLGARGRYDLGRELIDSQQVIEVLPIPMRALPAAA